MIFEVAHWACVLNRSTVTPSSSATRIPSYRGEKQSVRDPLFAEKRNKKNKPLTKRVQLNRTILY